jgi:uncharacterized protein
MQANQDFFRSSTVSFADVAHQTLIFDRKNEEERLVLELMDTRWMQRLRHISQTGNTKLVYMFAEHSRFGHSLGVAYLAVLLMKNLRERSPHLVEPYKNAVAAAALLHDMGHVAPGSHLGEKTWAEHNPGQHEQVTLRVIGEDAEIRNILARYNPDLSQLVINILSGQNCVPPWTKAVIGGGGWNADRGNWSMVDSAMCAVSYGRYNVTALIDAFRLSQEGELVLQENRLDALTHFFVARDSMYRQVYQHRVLQAADSLIRSLVLRLRDLLQGASDADAADRQLESLSVFCDKTMLQALMSTRYAFELPLETIFCMTESWWNYHVGLWCQAKDKVVADLAQRCRDRRLFKTVRLDEHEWEGRGKEESKHAQSLLEQAKAAAESLGLPPRYYVCVIEEKDKHREKAEQLPMVALDNGEIVPLFKIEPMIDQIIKRPPNTRRWLAVPKSVKDQLGRMR